MTPEAEHAYTVDEGVRRREDIIRLKRNEYWRTKVLEYEDRHIQDYERQLKFIYRPRKKVSLLKLLSFLIP